jgi:hypothetical protein
MRSHVPISVLRYQRDCPHQLVHPSGSFNGTLTAILQGRRRANRVPGAVLHMINTKSANSTFNSDQMTHLGFKQAYHPPEIADLTSADFFLVRWLNGELARRSLSSRGFRLSHRRHSEESNIRFRPKYFRGLDRSIEVSN